MRYQDLLACLDSFYTKAYCRYMHNWVTAYQLGTLKDREEIGHVSDAFLPDDGSDDAAEARYEHLRQWLQYRIESP